MTPEGLHARTWQLLGILADGHFHSGEVLAGQLGVSRASVFNALAATADCGVTLQRVRGRGYRLAQPWQRLQRDEIAGWLENAHGNVAVRDDETCQARSPLLNPLPQAGEEANESLREFNINETGQFDIEIVMQAASSNTLLLQRAALGAPGGSVVAVELQSAGRGRLGRTWYSGLGNALTFSLLWRFDCGLNALSGLSLAVGIAVVRALNKAGVRSVGLKWPNDILCAQGKLGGVLIEAQGDMLGPSAVVIGIGLNCHLPESLVRQIDQPACALDELGEEMPTRNRLLALLLLELSGVLREFGQGGFGPLRGEWERYHLYQDCPVQLHLADGSEVSGVARGVAEGGELLLETALGLRRFNSGEVGVRR